MENNYVALQLPVFESLLEQTRAYYSTENILLVWISYCYRYPPGFYNVFHNMFTVNLDKDTVTFLIICQGIASA